MILSVWSQARTWATRVGDQLASQEVAISNARRASTQLLRRRVERDEVEIFLDDLDERDQAPAGSSPEPRTPSVLPAQRAVEPRH